MVLPTSGGDAFSMIYRSELRYRINTGTGSMIPFLLSIPLMLEEMNMLNEMTPFPNQEFSGVI
jgi:hypothetical protein